MQKSSQCFMVLSNVVASSKIQYGYQFMFYISSEMIKAVQKGVMRRETGAIRARHFRGLATRQHTFRLNFGNFFSFFQIFFNTMVTSDHYISKAAFLFEKRFSDS